MKRARRFAFKHFCLIAALMLAVTCLPTQMYADGPPPMPVDDESGGTEAVAIFVAGAEGLRVLQRKRN